MKITTPHPFVPLALAITLILGSTHCLHARTPDRATGTPATQTTQTIGTSHPPDRANADAAPSVTAPAAGQETDTARAQAQPPGQPGQPVQPRQNFTDELFMAQEWQAKGNLEAARRSLQDALRLDPADAFALIRLAQVDAASGELNAALDGLVRVLAADSGNLLALRWQGHVLLALGRTEDAETRYRLIQSLDPSDGWAMLGLAACRLVRGGEGVNPEVAALLAKTQAAAGEDADLHLALADTFTGLGLLNNARLEIERYLDERPRDASALTLAGEVYIRLGLEPLALNAWRQALDLDQTAGWARFELLDRLGRIARRALTDGRTDEATRTWQVMLTYDPRSPVALEGLRELQAGAQGQAK